LNFFARDFGRQKDGFEKHKKWLGKNKWVEKPPAVGPAPEKHTSGVKTPFVKGCRIAGSGRSGIYP
jgi:hypothetical protein